MWRLSLLFGAFYFIQGVCEPTEGLISQPVRSLLKTWGLSAAEIGSFAALLSLPWSIKPIYGLLTDLVPLFGMRRKSYLMLTTGAAAASLGALALLRLERDAATMLFCLLLVSTVSVAFFDVVVDALMVERSQPLGLTGRLQSVQWTAIWAATILTGFVGGYLSEYRMQHAGFAIASTAVAVGLFLTVVMVKEPPRPAKVEALTLREIAVRAGRLPVIWIAGAFIFLWTFNPFSTSVLYLHMTREMHFSETFYGQTISIAAVGSLLGSMLYGTYCRRVSMRSLLNVCVAMGVVCTAAYAAMYDELSAQLAAMTVGFAYATATMVQLDLAAQVCPPEMAGTLFALLMAVSNLGVSLSTWLGGHWYDEWSETWGAKSAFQLLVVVGASLTACCWLLVPLLVRSMRRS